MNSKKLKLIWLILRIVLTCGAWALGIYLLYRYEYFIALTAIDNAVGALPVALVLICIGCFTALLWIKFTKKRAPITIILALMVALTAGLFPNSLRGNWWLNLNASDVTDPGPDLSVYAPYTGSKTARLSDASTLRLDSDLPLLDGALALYPVYTAFAEAVYDRTACETENSIQFTNTLKAFDSIIAGTCDVIFTAAASKTQLESAKAAGVELKFTPIGKEAFVFIVGKENPVDNLSVQQIRNIYSGKTANWHTLGWKEGGRIVAFQRPEGSGSQTGLQLIMGDLPIVAPQPLPDKSLVGSNSLMQQISVYYKGVQPALGYSYKYFATSMYSNPDARLLKVNGIEPSVENIRQGTYPFVAEFYAVTNGEPRGNTKLLIDWILSPQGQELIEKTGYTPIN